MVRYATRDDVCLPLDIRPDAAMASRVDRAIDSASRQVETLCNRRTGFYPTLATRTFDYPNDQNARVGRLWLDGTPLISLTSMTSGGVAVPTGNVMLRPDNGPPFDYIEIDRSTSSSLASGNTAQRSLSLTGLWGRSNDESAAGTAGALTSSATTLTATVPIGVGSLIRVDSERMEVMEAGWIAGPTLSSTPTASAADASLTLSSTSGIVPGETLLIDSERMLVVEVVSGTVVNVKRAHAGSPLAAHAPAAVVYRALSLTVTRGAAGTTAATHSASASVFRWIPPHLVSALTIAYAQDQLLQENSGYARMLGTGRQNNTVDASGIRVLEKRVYAAHGRKARHRAV